MFDSDSRYSELEVATLDVVVAGETRTVRYVRRRFLPALPLRGASLEHLVIQGERIDLVTARYLGTATDFWRVCDANLIELPDAAVWPGRRLVVPLSGT